MKLVLQTQQPVYGGYVLARRDGVVHFVRGALPGETVEAEVTGERKGHRFAETRAVLDPSPHRVPPPCPVFAACGGCHLQHADYPYQVAMKVEALRDVLRRIAGVVPGEIPATPSEPFRYRHRGRFKLDAEGAGFFREGTHELVRFDGCPLMVPAIEAFLPALRRLPGARGVTDVSILSNGTESLLRLDGVPFHAAALDRLSAAGASGLRFADRALGRESIVFPMPGVRYEVSAGGFLQANWKVNLALVDRIGAVVASAGKEARLLDLYAGAGNFAVPLAGRTRETVAVEGNDDSFRDLRRNIVANDLRNCRAVRSPVERFRPAGRSDVVLLDPPRAGLSRPVHAILRSIAPERIVYVSCDPSTLARDLARLADRYEVREVELFDFFPQTWHIETMAVLFPRRSGG